MAKQPMLLIFPGTGKFPLWDSIVNKNDGILLFSVSIYCISYTAAILNSNASIDDFLIVNSSNWNHFNKKFDNRWFSLRKSGEDRHKMYQREIGTPTCVWLKVNGNDGWMVSQVILCARIVGGQWICDNTICKCINIRFITLHGIITVALSVRFSLVMSKVNHGYRNLLPIFSCLIFSCLI